ncbi:MAG TPA: serine hydrolase domain-containing protein [Vicinamibacterales bacterium]|nr:serine hydrolase domain-containing protein [Vicinamibacterales bacterium]
MSPYPLRPRPALAGLAILAAALFLQAGLGAREWPPPAARQASAAVEDRVNEIFSKWTGETPGCAVGVASDGRVVLEKAYGLANLEHDVRNRRDTIFEAGSISKQFTAAAVLLLAHDGKLSLDDPVRKYIPELPDYGTPLTIRHMLTHTAGLRDWGSVAALGGWPRTTRAYTHAHVLDIAARQRALNFAPGTNWSYSNTGYNLAVILVSRVAGQSFAEFCSKRLFEPLHMRHTSWRDDHTRVVKARAAAYAEGKEGYRTLMPFENVHGNGGLLTTVGDLLRWNDHLDSPGRDAAAFRQLQEPARLETGQTLDYAFGLFVRKHKDVDEVAHSGTTAGYTAYLARYPGKRLSVAVLCNLNSIPAPAYAHAVADLFLGTAGPPAPRRAAAAPAGAPSLEGRTGLYRHVVTGRPMTITADKSGLRLNGVPLVPISPVQLESADGSRAVEFDAGSGAVLRLANGMRERYERVQAARPTVEDLEAFTGLYVSEEAETGFQVVVQNGELRMWRRPNAEFVLAPVYADGFTAPGLGIIRFFRAEGRVVEMGISDDRVWDLRLQRVGTK